MEKNEDKWLDKKHAAIVFLVVAAILAVAIVFGSSSSEEARKRNKEVYAERAAREEQSRRRIGELEEDIRKSESNFRELRKDREAKESALAKQRAEEYMASKASTERADAAIERARVRFGNSLADAEGR